MFLQAVIETVYYFMLPKFTEDCNRLLRNVAAVWQIQRDAWGSAHTACVTQQCLHVNWLSANDSEETMATKLSKFEPPTADIISGERWM